MSKKDELVIFNGVTVKRSILVSLGLIKCPHGHLYPQLGGENRCKLCSRPPKSGKKSPTSKFPKPGGKRPPWAPSLGHHVRPRSFWSKLIHSPCEYPDHIRFDSKWGSSPSVKKCVDLVHCQYYLPDTNGCRREVTPDDKKIKQGGDKE